MEKIVHANSATELMQILELERLILENHVNGEIALIVKTAESPMIRRYFENPDDSALEAAAFEELASYQNALVGKSMFWVNDKDKKFYIDGKYLYLLDTEDPANYWYNMTLYDTETYNFNINYNPNLNNTNLWINAVVHNSDKKPIAVLGTGIDIEAFINTIFSNYSHTADIYFFNDEGEITGTNNVQIAAEKRKLEEELPEIGKEIFAKVSTLNTNEIQNFKINDWRGIAAIGRIPALNWYAAVILPLGFMDAVKTPMTFLFLAMMLLIAVIFTVANDKLNAQHTAYKSEIAKTRAEAAKEAVLSSINYASKIQRNILPPQVVMANIFSDFSVIWKPLDIVSGDIYWMKQFDKGTVLCVCDCTGHGTSGALLTMLVVSTLESIIRPSNCNDTADIVWKLDQKLSRVLNVKTAGSGTEGGTSGGDDGVESNIMNIKDGCDIAVLFVEKNGSVTFSAGKIPVFVSNGTNVFQHKGQKIFVGEGRIKSKDEVNVYYIPADTNNKFYIASDGLFEQKGGEKGRQFGYNIFKQIILKNHNEKQSVITGKVWEAFEKYRSGQARRDDFELIAFMP